MKKVFRIFLICFAVFVVLTGAGIYTLDRLFSGMCGNAIYLNENAPGGRIKAVVFQRDCGATTGLSTQVSILPSGESLPNESGNTFIVDGYPDDISIELSWISPSELVIHHSAHLETYKKETRIKGVNITYK